MERLTLSFNVIDCERCGARRQTRFACPDCGKAAAPTEVDFKVQERQRAVLEATSARAQPDEIDATAMDLRTSGQLAQLPTRIFDTADRLAKGEDGAASEFAAVAREVASLENWADAVVPLRPLITLTREMQSAVRSLVTLYDVVAAALVEERLDRAQQAGEAVQHALDEASIAVGNANVIHDRAERVLNAPDPVAAWVAEAVNGDLIAASNRGAALFESRTDRAVSPSSGFAAVFYDVALSTIGDPLAFWALVSSQLELLEEIGAGLTVIVSDPIFSARAVDVSHDVWEAARRAAVAPEAPTLRAASSQLLESGHLLIEQALKFHLGTLCALTTKMSFADTQACDVSQLVQIANDKTWAISAGIGDVDIRNAFAHRDFEMAGSAVSLSPQRRRSDGRPQRLVSLDRVQDGVLHLVETLAAMDLALGARDGRGRPQLR